MGTEYYLVNEEKKQLFELGKGIYPAFDLIGLYKANASRGVIESGLTVRLQNISGWDYQQCAAYAKEIIEEIDKTIGFYNTNLCIGDTDDRLYENYGDFMIVGTRYSGDKSFVGKTFNGRHDD